MKEVIEFLAANQMGCLATVEDGKPRVRPWGFMFEQDGKLWFCTANTKEVFKQLQKNPSVEFCSTSKDFVTVRLRGEVVFKNDLAVKEKVLASNPMVKGIYKEASNPIFEVFCLEHGIAVMSDFSMQPPKVYEF